MPPETAKYLRDMLDCAGKIREHTQAHTIDDYLRDHWLRDAINWNFSVIGEALSQLRRIDATTAERITEYWKIIGFRNQLIHGYNTIDPEITWSIIGSKLPVLIQELEQLLKE